jgi:hypothetical protein
MISPCFHSVVLALLAVSSCWDGPEWRRDSNNIVWQCIMENPSWNEEIYGCQFLLEHQRCGRGTNVSILQIMDGSTYRIRDCSKLLWPMMYRASAWCILCTHINFRAPIIFLLEWYAMISCWLCRPFDKVPSAFTGAEPGWGLSGGKNILIEEKKYFSSGGKALF